MQYSVIQDLRNIYLTNNEAAIRGMNTIDSYLRKKNNSGLANILRYHYPKGITNEETWIRDEIDYLLEYYSIIALSFCVGYVSYEDLLSVQDEMDIYLKNQFVQKYYYDYYPLIFPQILYEIGPAKNAFIIGKRSGVRVHIDFQGFHALNQSISNKDVDQFLWFLDGGKNHGYGLIDLKGVLEDVKVLSDIIAAGKDDALSQSTRGFLEYLVFLQGFQTFIRKINNEVDKSAYWMYHGYWFLKIRDNLKGSIMAFHKGMQQFTRSNSDFSSAKKRRLKEEIHYSKSSYDLLLKEFLFTKKYEKLFNSHVKNWRTA